MPAGLQRLRPACPEIGKRLLRQPIQAASGGIRSDPAIPGAIIETDEPGTESLQVLGEKRADGP